MKKRLNPVCDYEGMIDYHPHLTRRGLAPVEGMFTGASHLDGFTRKSRRRMASTRIGSPTRAAQSMVEVMKRECPWQLYQNPETGRVQIERRYNPEDEPLTQHIFENSYAESEVA